MIEVRQATEKDIEGIRDLFIAAYGDDYSHPAFYNLHVLKKMVFDDDMLLLVAVGKSDGGHILGTASVIFDVGMFGDLVGEFGRLVVHPEGRHRGIGKKLMKARIEHAQERLHIGFVENRAVHPFSQRISDRYGFTPAGFLPQKFLVKKRESLALYICHFGDALKFRRNHPHVIPEAFLLAQNVLSSCGLEPDVIFDDEAPSYPDDEQFELEDMTTKGYATVLRFERARANQKEIFGPARIHQGLFRLEATHSYYVIAREGGQLVGAIGFAVDEVEKSANIFEVVTVDSRPIRCLIKEVSRKCREEFGVVYLETDVSAYSPSMQRTLLELQFVPVGYLPALAFHGAERCDAVRMVRLFVPLDISGIDLIKASKPVAEIVLRNFSTRDLLPRLAETLPNISLFSGLTDEQVRRMAEICTLKNYSGGKKIIKAGQPRKRAFVVLEGRVQVSAGAGEAARPVGVISNGECLGETALLNPEPHTVSAETREETETAVIERDDLIGLMRRRPDIGVVLYKNLAESLGQKLRNLDAELADQRRNGKN